MAAVFQRVASAIGQSVSIDIGAAGNDRLLICQYGDESLGTDDVAMGGTPVVDAKSFTLRIAKTNPDGIGNQQEMWTIDEAALGASNGVLTVSGGGVDASSAIRVELWYGADSGVPHDTGFDDTTIAPTDSSISMDAPAGGIVVLGYGNGNSFNTSGWTSPLIERIDAATNPPASAGLGYASGIEASAQTAKTYTATGTVTLRSTMLGMSFAEAVTGQTISVGQAVETDTSQAITVSPGAVAVAVGQATETNIAQAIVVAAVIALAVGQATETNIAQAVTPSQTTNVVVGQATETDLAQAVTLVAGAVTISVGQAVETDLAIPIKQPPVSIARWLLNEASSGQGPTTAADDTGNGNDLTSIQYGGTDLNWTNIAAGRGLSFSPNDHSAIVELDNIVANGNIGSSLDNAKQFSFIIRADLIAGLGTGSRVFFIGTDGGNGDIALITDSSLGVQVRMNDSVGSNEASYATSFPAGLHTWGVTVDTTLGVTVDRVKLYKDGVLQTVTATDFSQDETLGAINNTNHNVNIGNRGNLNRGCEADIYYVELFTGCLPESEHLRAHNALVNNNDINWTTPAISVGQATETNIAQAITVIVGGVTVAMGQAIETDLAQSITVLSQITIVVGQATETDLAQVVAPVSGQVITVGQAVETDLAQAVRQAAPFEIVLSAFVPTGGIATTDRLIGGNAHDGGRLTDDQNPSDAVDLAANRSGEFAFVLQPTDLGEDGVEYSFRLVISPSTPLDTYAVEATWTIGSGIQVGQAFETDLAQPITIIFDQTITVGQALETDIAQDVTVVPGVVSVAVGQATEADLAQSVTVAGAITITVGQAVETDIAQSVTAVAGVVTIGVGQAFETDLAQAITVVPGATTISVGQAIEIDLAQAVAIVSGEGVVGVGQAVETDLAQTVTVVPGGLTIAVGQASETDVAQTITPVPVNVIAVGQAIETDLAQAVNAVIYLTISLDQAIETDLAQVVTVVPGTTTIAVGQALEIDIAQTLSPITGAVSILVGQAFEIDLAQVVGVTVGKFVECSLVDRTGKALPNLTTLSWAWFDAVDPSLFIAPTDKGEIETTDGTGLISIKLDNTTLDIDSDGTLVLRSDDGVSLGSFNLTIVGIQS